MHHRHHRLAWRRIRVKFGVPQLNHRVIFRQDHMRHGPVSVATLGNFLQHQHFHILMATVLDDAVVKAVDHTALTFKHLQVQTLALAQGTCDAAFAVGVQSAGQDRVRHRGGLWADSTAHIKKPNSDRAVFNFIHRRSVSEAGTKYFTLCQEAESYYADNRFLFSASLKEVPWLMLLLRGVE